MDWFNVTCAYCKSINPVMSDKAEIDFKCRFCSRVQHATIQELKVKVVEEKPKKKKKEEVSVSTELYSNDFNSNDFLTNNKVEE